MGGVALLSVGVPDGVRARRLRGWSARTGAFHYDADGDREVAEAMRTIARVRPRLIAIDGGDSAVAAALSAERIAGAPILVLPRRGGLIARDLGAGGCALRALSAVAALDPSRLAARVTARRPLLIETADRRLVGMTLGRRRGEETTVRIGGEGRTISGRFGVLLVSALSRWGAGDRLKLVAVDGRLPRLVQSAAAWAGARVAHHGGRGGLFVACADMLMIEGAGPDLMLDGAALPVGPGALRLSLAAPVGFVTAA